MLRRVVDFIPDNIFIKDDLGRYILSNKAHLRDLKMETWIDVVGKTAYDFFSSDIAQDYHQQDLGILHSGCPKLNVEEERKDTNGKQRWLLTSKVPLELEEIDFKGIVGISRDVTVRKNAEIQLKETLKVLKNTQLKLLDAEKLKTMGRMAASVAHEIKNPLAIVSLGLEYLQKNNKQQELEEILTDMSEALENANQVIFELLEYARPHDLEFAQINLNEEIKKSVHMLKPKLQEFNIVLTLDFCCEPLWVKADPLKIDQVIINLLMNACSAMDRGGHLSIKTCSERIKGTGAKMGRNLSEVFQIGQRVAQIDIEDSGCGIPEKHLLEVFEPFFTSNRCSEGTGLGLSVVKTIIDLHHGAVGLSNRSCGGVRARILLPISQQPNIG